jgi:hypothetical protein
MLFEAPDLPKADSQKRNAAAAIGQPKLKYL